MCAAYAKANAPLLGGGSGEALVFTDNPEICDAVARIIDAGAVSRVTVLEGGIASALEAPMPDVPVTVVDVSSSPDPVTDVAMLSEVTKGRIVAMGPVNDVAFYRTLIAAGASDYLVVPPTDDMLIDALTPPKVQVEAEATDQCRIVSVVGARGGVGSTTVSVNVAWHLAHNYGLRTGLVDLDLHFGTCALSLDLLPGRGLRDALDNPERIDPLFIASAMVNESENLFILGGEEPLESKSELNAYAIDPLMSALRANFSSLVFDMPKNVAISHPTLIQESASVLLVTDFSLAGMRDVLRMKSFVKDFCPNTKTEIVAVGAKDKNGALTQRDFEKGIEGKVDYVIPYDPKLAAEAANGGKAISAMAGGGKTVGKTLTTIADAIVGDLQKVEKKRSWWRK
ncbi:MAG: AAA family ATPase [Alphaproteobacteria bacterium]